MVRRRALIVDRDKPFTARLRGCLRALGFSVEVAESRRDTLERIRTKPPAIVFIAVERPKKAGFALFSDIKRLSKNVPIALATATVPMSEMMLHQKLRLHADLYLDKRGMTEAEILGTLCSLLRLRIDSSDLAEMASAVSRAVALSADETEDDEEGAVELPYPSTRETAAEDGGIDDPLDEELDDDGAFDSFTAPGDTLDPPPLLDTPLRGDPALREKLHRLSRELERARRAAGSSPFSKEYLRLGDRLERSEQRLVRLEAELELARREGESLRTKIVDTSRFRTGLERARDQAIDRARTFEDRIQELEQELGREREANRAHAEEMAQETGQRIRSEQDHAFSVEKLRDQFARECREAVEQAEAEAAQCHELETTRLLADHEQAIAAMKQQMAEGLRDERRRTEREWRSRLEEAERRHANEIESATAFARAERDRLEEEQRDAIEGLREQNRTREASHEARQAEAIEELEERHRVRESSLEEEHRRTLEERLAESAQDSRNQLRAREQEWEAKLDDLRQRHTEEIDKIRREAAEERDRLTDRLYKSREKAFAERDSEWQDRLEQLCAEHAKGLTAIRDEHAAKLTELNRLHQRETAERDEQHARALERMTTELRRERTQSVGQLTGDVERIEKEHREEIDRLEARYADEIAVLERVHQEEVQELGGRFAAERERTREEHAAAFDELAGQLRRDQRVTIDGREAEWQKRVDLLRQEYEQALESEREELETVIEALDAARVAAEGNAAHLDGSGRTSGSHDDEPARSDEPETVEPERRRYRILGRVAAGKLSKPDRASELLRHLAAELDDLGASTGRAEIDMPDVDAAFGESDRPAER